MRKRTVIYTAIFGNRDKLKEPEYVPEDCEFVCFTDQSFRSKLWKVKKIDPVYKHDLTRSNRFLKILPHRELSEYQISIYIDGHLVIAGDINELVEQYLADANMAALDMSHYSTLPMSSLKEQFELLILPNQLSRHKESSSVLQSQYQTYVSEGYPDDQGLIMGGVLLRRHNEPDVIKAMEAWWHEVETRSKRDQMSFNYVAWKTSFKFNYIPIDLSNNPYINKVPHHKTWSTKFIHRLRLLGTRVGFRRELHN